MKFVDSIYIDAPPKTVFEYVSSVEKMKVMDPSVKSVTITSSEKKGVGVKSHWICVREGIQKEWDEVVVEYDPPTAFGFKIITEWRLTEGRHVLTPKGSGTWLEFTEHHISGEFDAEHIPEQMRAGLEKIKRWAEEPNK